MVHGRCCWLAALLDRYRAFFFFFFNLALKTPVYIIYSELKPLILLNQRPKRAESEANIDVYPPLEPGEVARITSDDSGAHQ